MPQLQEVAIAISLLLVFLDILFATASLDSAAISEYALDDATKDLPPMY